MTRLTLTDTRFPATKHLQVVISEVQNEADALRCLFSTFLSVQTDRLHGDWDKESHTLTIQGFVHSSEDC